MFALMPILSLFILLMSGLWVSHATPEFPNGMSAMTQDAEAGDVDAQFNLGLHYFKGEGVSQNDALAKLWYTRAAAQGDVTAQYNLGLMAAMGLLAGRLAVAEITGQPLEAPPPETAMGALITHITGGADAKTFQPMNVNFGLFPPIDAKGGRRGRKDRYKAYTDRAKAAFLHWLGLVQQDAA